MSAVSTVNGTFGRMRSQKCAARSTCPPTIATAQLTDAAGPLALTRGYRRRDRSRLTRSDRASPCAASILATSSTMRTSATWWP